VRHNLHADACASDPICHLHRLVDYHNGSAVARIVNQS
jgi:hypothetical protein